MWLSCCRLIGQLGWGVVSEWCRTSRLLLLVEVNSWNRLWVDKIKSGGSVVWVLVVSVYIIVSATPSSIELERETYVRLSPDPICELATNEIAAQSHVTQKCSGNAVCSLSTIYYVLNSFLCILWLAFHENGMLNDIICILRGQVEVGNFIRQTLPWFHWTRAGPRGQASVIWICSVCCDILRSSVDIVLLASLCWAKSTDRESFRL